MKKRILLIILISVVSIFSLGYILLKISLSSLSGYLSKTEEVKSNILLVEGWMPDNALQMAYKEFEKNGYKYIITTGLKSPSKYYNVACDGFMIYYLRNRFSDQSESSHHTIEIEAFSELEGANCAHFNMFVNDSLVKDFLADKRKRVYGINWTGRLKNIDSVLIQFTNDGMGDYGDRNLYVNELIIDHKFRIPYQKNSEYDVGEMDGKRRLINNFNSSAESARNRLLSLGIDSSSIIAIPGQRASINRTLKSALAFRDWLKTTKIDIKGINIISLGTHTRRTWMTYNRILSKKYKIGIISIPDYNAGFSGKKRLISTIRETLGVIYYWIILIPY